LQSIVGDIADQPATVHVPKGQGGVHIRARRQISTQPAKGRYERYQIL
jgi:hypothetical protein